MSERFVAFLDVFGLVTKTRTVTLPKLLRAMLTDHLAGPIPRRSWR